MAELLCPTIGCNNSDIVIYIDPKRFIEIQCLQCGKTHIYKKEEEE